MAEHFTIHPGDTVAVTVLDSAPFVSVEIGEPSPWGVVTVQGPQGVQGPPGDPGPAYSSPAWFFDDGPPSTIVGSKPGDLYMDLLTGTIYKLGD